MSLNKNLDFASIVKLILIIIAGAIFLWYGVPFIFGVLGKAFSLVFGSVIFFGLLAGSAWIYFKYRTSEHYNKK